MKILLTGGGSGGHFYPIIAVAEAIRKLAIENKLIDVELYYMAPQPYDKKLLFDNKIIFVQISAGKMRRYFSILNFLDVFRTVWGVFGALWAMYKVYPDIVFAKGGYVSFPALIAARFFRIPVIIHESDSYPGRLNLWAGKFARRIAVSYPQAAVFFPQEKVAYTGNPIRQEIIHAVPEGSHDFLKIDKSTPTVLVLGGSQGAKFINENVLDALPKLVEKYQVIHQTGAAHLDSMKEMSRVILDKSMNKDRYHPHATLDSLTLRMAAGAADIIISRAGSTIFEIAAWGVPSILIPITDSNGDHQRKNAYNYARTGAAAVIEENNLTPNILVSEVIRLMENPEQREAMKKAAKSFARLDSAELIAKEVVAIALEHEK